MAWYENRTLSTSSSSSPPPSMTIVSIKGVHCGSATFTRMKKKKLSYPCIHSNARHMLENTCIYILNYVKKRNAVIIIGVWYLPFRNVIYTSKKNNFLYIFTLFSPSNE